MLNSFQITSYLDHWLHAVDEHSLHSPFFFDFYLNVVKKDIDLITFQEIEKVRATVLKDTTPLELIDLGAASKYFKNSDRTISQVAATSLASIKKAQLLTRIAANAEAKQIIELGTSLGVTALYLASNQEATVHTFEGNPSMVQIALTNFEYLEKKNINLIEGNIDQTLPDFIQLHRGVDFVLIDANHKYEPTLHYFQLLVNRLNENSVVVIDDIYYSKEMAKAWKELRHHNLVYGSMDLYELGILFFDPSLNKQHHAVAW